MVEEFLCSIFPHVYGGWFKVSAIGTFHIEGRAAGDVVLVLSGVGMVVGGPTRIFFDEYTFKISVNYERETELVFRLRETDFVTTFFITGFWKFDALCSMEFATLHVLVEHVF